MEEKLNKLNIFLCTVSNFISLPSVQRAQEKLERNKIVEEGFFVYFSVCACHLFESAASRQCLRVIRVVVELRLQAPGKEQ